MSNFVVYITALLYMQCNYPEHVWTHSESIVGITTGVWALLADVVRGFAKLYED